MSVDVEAVATALRVAERDRAPIDPLGDGLKLADAYRIQTAGRALREADGGRLVGRKVGLTSPAMQKMLGVDQPDFGYVLDEMIHESGVRLDAGRLIAPRAEAEIAFRLRAPLRGAEITRADALAATDAVAPALEIIDSRIVDWRIAITDTIADNASCGCFVIGEWRPVDGLDLATLEATMTVTGADGAEETSSGPGSAVLGHPAEALVWLARALHSLGDEALEAGQVVLPGAVSRALSVDAGSHVHADFGALGQVEMTMAGRSR